MVYKYHDIQTILNLLIFIIGIFFWPSPLNCVKLKCVFQCIGSYHQISVYLREKIRFNWYLKSILIVLKVKENNVIFENV